MSGQFAQCKSLEVPNLGSTVRGMLSACAQLGAPDLVLHALHAQGMQHVQSGWALSMA